MDLEKDKFGIAFAKLWTSSKLLFVLLFSSLGLSLVSLYLFFVSLIPSGNKIIIEKHSDDKLIESRIVVDLSGAVMKPGVYSLIQGSRLKDVIEQAGGFSHEADQDSLSQSFNLASQLKDGQKIFVPPKGFIQEATHTDVLGATSSLTSININKASEKELDALSGVGKITVGKIIAGRPYASIEELQDKKIVSKSVYEKIKDHISAY
ncbi:MAG: helix-hairpin-helix domain-containing protein [Candidatus Roizmanbacteria bacterium]